MMPPAFRTLVLAIALLLPGLADAASPEPGPPAATPPAPLTPAPVTPVQVGGAAAATKPAAPLNDTQQYCQNIAAAAADARFAWQRKQLTDLQAELKTRVADLEAKEAELKAIIGKREAMMKTTADTVVGIFSHMKPDAAATQLAALDEDMAASILAQLTQQKASVILNEIPADKAAKLVAAMTNALALGKKS